MELYIYIYIYPIGERQGNHKTNFSQNQKEKVWRGDEADGSEERESVAREGREGRVGEARYGRVEERPY